MKLTLARVTTVMAIAAIACSTSYTTDPVGTPLRDAGGTGGTGGTGGIVPTTRDGQVVAPQNTCPAGEVSCGACTKVAADSANCGKCGNKCPTPADKIGQAVCNTGVCQLECPNGLVFSGDRCVTSCPPSQTKCGTTCVNSLDTDVNNCGVCGKSCGGTANGRGVCSARACSIKCDDGYQLDNGECKRPSVGCAAGEVRCDATRCAAPTSTPSNCGGCGTVCPAGPANSSPTCSGTTCGWSCNTGFGLSGGACVANAGCQPWQASCGGTCTSLDTDFNCGTCGRRCDAEAPANGTAVCESRDCKKKCNNGFALTPQNTCVTATCGANQQLCSGACRDYLTDPNFCGTCTVSCGTVANGSRSCSGGGCVTSCNSGYTSDGNQGCKLNTAACQQNEIPCGGGCADPLTDKNNCNTCGNVCPAPTGGDSFCFGTYDFDTNTTSLPSSCNKYCTPPQVLSADGARCEAPACAAGSERCDGTNCIPKQDVQNCGACGNVCRDDTTGDVGYRGTKTCFSSGGTSKCGLQCPSGYAVVRGSLNSGCKRCDCCGEPRIRSDGFGNFCQ